MSGITSLSNQFGSTSPKNGQYFIVAIDGRAGAGKTTFATYLKSLLSDFCFICGDDYFEPISHPITWGGYNEVRFFKDVIKPLQKTEKVVNYRPYTWEEEPHVNGRKLNISRGVVIDRIYSFSFDLDYDLTIWVETPRAVALKRGITRSSMPEDKAEKAWREIWKPMEDQYILETRPADKASIVIDGTKPFSQQLSI